MMNACPRMLVRHILEVVLEVSGVQRASVLDHLERDGLAKIALEWEVMRLNDSQPLLSTRHS